MLRPSAAGEPKPHAGIIAWQRVPVVLFSMLPESNLVSFGLSKREKELVELDELPASATNKITALRGSLQQMHKKASYERERQTALNKNKQKRATRENFDVGDYVLRSRVDEKHKGKLLVTCIGPYQVVGADEHSFRVRHLGVGAKHAFHGSRV